MSIGNVSVPSASSGGLLFIADSSHLWRLHHIL
jgi:hypothetical protein